MAALVMISGLNDDFYMYMFTLQTLICQIFFMAWMGDKLTETVFLAKNVKSAQ